MFQALPRDPVRHMEASMYYPYSNDGVNSHIGGTEQAGIGDGGSAIIGAWPGVPFKKSEV